MLKVYQLTEKEKQELVDKLTQDVSWSQDEIYANEDVQDQDVSQLDDEEELVF